MSYSSLIGKLIAPVISALCVAVIISLQLSVLGEIETQATQIKSKDFYLLESEQEKANLELVKKLPNFGFDNLIANWAFLRFLQYFGDQDARQQVGYGLSSDYFEVFVERNPKFVEPYKFMSPATSIFGGQPDKSVNFLNQGLKSLSPETSPEAYTIWVSKASDELLFLGNNQAARRSYIQAAKWAQKNPDPEAQRIAKIVTSTAAFLSQNPDSRNARISAWLMVLRNAGDDMTRQRAIQEIQAMGGNVVITEQNTIKVQFPKQVKGN